MGTPRIDLEKFNGKNDFNMWKIKMEALLITQGLGDAIEPISKKEGKEVSSSKTPEEAAEVDKKARSIIILSLGDAVIREVAKEKTVAGLWAKLEGIYMTKSLANRLYIKKRMFTLKMVEGSSLDHHIDEFNKVCDTLESIDEGLNDEGKALLLISSLPKSYEHFVDALMYGRQSLTLDEVKAALNTRELQGKQNAVESGVGEGLTARGRFDNHDEKKKKEGKQKKKQKGWKCFQCHKEGHLKRDCPERKFKPKDSVNRSGDAAIVEEEGYESAGVYVATDCSQKGKWILDSGCTFHMTPFKDYFTEYHIFDGGRVMMGNNAMCRVIGIGTVKLRLQDGTLLMIKQVRHVPDLKRNLISLGMFDQIGYSIRLESGDLRVLDGSKTVLKGNRKNGVYVLDGEIIAGESGFSGSIKTDHTRLWDLRLGHISEKGLKELEKQGVLGKEKIGSLEFCEDCVFGKSSRASFKRSNQKSENVLDYIHSDLWGPAQELSLGGNRYFVSFIDDFSRKVWTYALKHKDQVFEKFKEWKSLVENQTGKKVKKLRTDNGLEFCNQQFGSYCANEGIMRHRTVKNTPQQNGLAERMNRTLMEKVRCMLIQSRLPKSLWAEVLMTASYLVNLSPSSALDFKTPFEMWHGKPASYEGLRAFGCSAYAHIKQGKLAPRALKGVFVGYPDGVKGYKIWCTDLRPPKCIISRDVIFNEDELIRKTQPAEETNSGEAQAPHQHVETELNPQIGDYQLTRDRKRRQIKPPRRFGYADLTALALAAAHNIADEEPKTFKEAVQSSNKREWLAAMDDEIASLYKNKTWELVVKPSNRRVVGCKWIYKVKEGLTQTEPRRFKARLVAKGYTQKEGVDFQEVFSPVVRHASIRVILALTAVEDMELDQLDVKTAFLHGRLQEEIFMSQPEGYEDPKKKNCVCLLKKSLYGLKQSPRQWYLRFNEFMVSNGFMRCNYDCCVYFKKINTSVYVYLLLYVDDMLLASKDREVIEELKLLLNSEFEMKDLGQAKKILGVEIRRNRKNGLLILSQESYLKNVLTTFGMTDSKPVQTPLASHFRLSSSQCPSTDEEKQVMMSVPYANAVGCLMYAMVLTRPDIAHAVSVISRYMASPGMEHWKAVKWVLRYLNGTLKKGLVYGRTRENEDSLWGYVDSDYAGDLDRRRSLTGYVFMLNGCVVNWKSALQRVVALSTTEAEYTAATEAVKEALWLRGLISELGKMQRTVSIFCDSSSAIHLCKNPAHHEKTKHIDIKLHFIRHEVSRGDVKMVKIHTDVNPADILTKAVPVAKFEFSLDLVGLGCTKLVQLNHVTVWEEIKTAATGDDYIQQVTTLAETQPTGLYTTKNGLVFYNGRVVVPHQIRDKLMFEAHNTRIGGHSGVLRTYKRLAQQFYWPAMFRTVQQYVNNCETCQRTKAITLRPAGLLQPLPIPCQVWDDITLDFIEGLPMSQGKNTIFVVIDRLSKSAHFMSLSHPFSAKIVAERFIEGIFKLHGMPKSIVSDRDPIFISKFWQEFFKMSGTKLSMSSAYHPQSDGQTEHEYLPWAEYWYNTTYHISTGMTPFKALYGRDPPTVPQYHVGTSPVNEVDKALLTRDELLAQLKRNLAIATNRMKQTADKHRRDVQFHKDDLVFLKLHPYRQTSVFKRAHQKLASKFFGPYRVLEKIGTVAYKLQLPAGARVHPVFHVSLLKKAMGDLSENSSDIPPIDDEGVLMLEPAEILDTRWLKRGGKFIEQSLVRWNKLLTEEATWEDLTVIQQQFPSMTLEDKGSLPGGGIVRQPRRSARVSKPSSKLVDFV
ncbi:hypothetical protein KPL70_021339 [Citrus sinensis]|nr:hypothetical protein KPL70_021339 [Citrus sinensis]